MPGEDIVRGHGTIKYQKSLFYKHTSAVSQTVSRCFANNKSLIARTVDSCRERSTHEHIRDPPRQKQRGRVVRTPGGPRA